MRKDSILDSTVFKIRSRLIDDLFKIIVVLSIPALASSLYRTQDTGWNNLVLIHITVAILLWCLFFIRNRINFWIRSSTLLSLFFIVGSSGLLNYGLSGTGSLFIIIFVVLVTLFFGLHGGLAALVVSELFIIVLSIAVIRRWVTFTIDFNVYNNSSSSWILLIFSLGLMIGAVVIVVDRLYSALFDALSTSLRQTDEVQRQAVELHAEISERKRAEQALQESEERYMALFERSLELVYLCDIEGNFIDANDAALELLGFTRNDIRSINFSSILTDDQLPIALKTVEEILKTGSQRKATEIKLRRKDGEFVYLESRGTIIYRKGKPYAIQGIARNITERKRAEEEKRILEERLNRAEKMESLGLLAGGVAHDLNNVLGIVIGYAELLLHDTDHSSSTRSKLNNIMEGGQKASAIVQDLLTLARRGVPVRNVINLNKIIADNQRSPEFANLFFHHSAVEIKTDLDPELLNISGSSVHLGNTIFNLVSNAMEAMPEGGVLTIKTANQYLDKPIQGYDAFREGEYVLLSVSDTGEGIHASDLKRIFEPFYTKKIMGRSGTGLGLAVVWGTVKDHDGYINVQSEKGKGSTFTLYFPLTREEISAEDITVFISEYIGNNESILVVDDVKGQRDLAEEMLKKLNYRVTSVSSGEEAVSYLKEHAVDLLILDMIMDPGMDGLDTYRSILEFHPKQKAIIVSGFSESDRVKTAQALGAGAYVKKPYVIEKLGLAVRAEFDRSV